MATSAGVMYVAGANHSGYNPSWMHRGHRRSEAFYLIPFIIHSRCHNSYKLLMLTIMVPCYMWDRWSNIFCLFNLYILDTVISCWHSKHLVCSLVLVFRLRDRHKDPHKYDLTDVMNGRMIPVSFDDGCNDYLMAWNANASFLPLCC